MEQEKLKFKADTVFIQYEDCISCISFAIIKYLLKHEEEYKDFIDYSKIKGKNDKILIRIALMRRTSNILNFLSKKDVEWDTNEAMRKIELNYDELYSESYKLTFFGTVTRFLFEPSFKSIFIYHPNPDKRYIKELLSNFDYTKNISKIKLVFNDNLEETLRNNNDISCFIVSNMDLAKYLLENNWVDNKEIIISETRYNICVNKEGDISPLLNLDKFITENNKMINYGLMKPLNMDITYFEDLIESHNSNK